MTTTSRPTPNRAPASKSSGAPWQPGFIVSALVGLVAMGLAIGIAELISAIGVWLAALSTASSPINSLGTTFIHLTPEWLKEYAIRTFGQHDKDALRVGMYVTLFVVSLIIGVIARRSPRIAAGVTVLLILVTIGAIYTTTGAIAFDALPILVGGAAGIYLLVTVFRRTVDPVILAGAPAGKSSQTGRRRSSGPGDDRCGDADGELYDTKPGTSGDQHPMALASTGPVQPPRLPRPGQEWTVASSSGWPPSEPLSPSPPAPSRAGSLAPRR